MNDPTYWMVFFGAALALNLSPGPDLIYVLSKTIAQGTKVGLASAAGVWTGAFVHALAAAFGLSAILMTSAEAFTVVKYAGAAYLIYLGIQALRSRGSSFDVSSNRAPDITPAQAFRQGVLVDVLNPKVAIFFMAFLPQFVRPDHGSPSMQLVGLGALIIVVAMPVETFFVVAASRTTRFFRQHASASMWLDRMLGTVLITLGVRLALFEQSR
ncbi:MAG TPA: LysE family translocator [Deltaproteobacteria bacterium]|nr:LysE family translocator [Deltaproteobacteria bacterium]HPR54424.1 LysE family translocator [Deltaproteobacteria bacterium]HXK46247.1 LysE family translocator [Deltaproteobacteria bacterium]